MVRVLVRKNLIAYKRRTHVVAYGDAVKVVHVSGLSREREITERDWVLRDSVAEAKTFAKEHLRQARMIGAEYG